MVVRIRMKEKNPRRNKYIEFEVGKSVRFSFKRSGCYELEVMIDDRIVYEISSWEDMKIKVLNDEMWGRKE